MDVEFLDGDAAFNRASIGGGVYVDLTSTFTVPALGNGLFEANLATASGGGLYVEGAATLNDSSVTNNDATTSGGGLYVEGTLVAGGPSCVITANKAVNGNGDSVFVDDGSATLTDCGVSGSTGLPFTMYVTGTGTPSLALTSIQNLDYAPNIQCASTGNMYNSNSVTSCNAFTCN